MDRQYDFAALEALLKKRSFKALREALLELNEVDIAEFLGLLNGEEAVLAFRTLPKGVAADVFAELEPETQQLIVAAATDAELAVIVEDLYVDDAVDMLEDMPANVVKRILKNATPEMRGSDQPVPQVSRAFRRQHYDSGIYRSAPHDDGGAGH